jgi:hypothetical protein
MDKTMIYSINRGHPALTAWTATKTTGPALDMAPSKGLVLHRVRGADNKPCWEPKSGVDALHGEIVDLIRAAAPETQPDLAELTATYMLDQQLRYGDRDGGTVGDLNLYPMLHQFFSRRYRPGKGDGHPYVDFDALRALLDQHEMPTGFDDAPTRKAAGYLLRRLREAAVRVEQYIQWFYASPHRGPETAWNRIHVFLNRTTLRDFLRQQPDTDGRRVVIRGVWDVGRKAVEMLKDLVDSIEDEPIRQDVERLVMSILHPPKDRPGQMVIAGLSTAIRLTVEKHEDAEKRRRFGKTTDFVVYENGVVPAQLASRATRNPTKQNEKAELPWT